MTRRLAAILLVALALAGCGRPRARVSVTERRTETGALPHRDFAAYELIHRQVLDVEAGAPRRMTLANGSALDLTLLGGRGEGGYPLEIVITAAGSTERLATTLPAGEPLLLAAGRVRGGALVLGFEVERH